jgi:histidinol dehydrogenase
MIRILSNGQIDPLLFRRTARLEEAEHAVQPILDDVQRRGDAALREYARRFDNFTGSNFLADPADLACAATRVTREFRAALEQASANIRAFAAFQLPHDRLLEIAPGILAGQIVRPLDTVAAYIPSGRYPLPSTLMMTAIPAQVAGVPRICVTSPRAVEEIDATAHLLGIHQVYRLGGAHAIAAFAFGTESVPRAGRIVGPGNIYVAAAKKLLSGQVGIDFVAGPTEILIIASDGDPRYLAADMLAQAEHDVEAAALLLTTSRALAERVAAEIDLQLATLSTRDVAAAAILRNSAILIVRSIEEAVDMSNAFAPEHLVLCDEALLGGIRNAGSVFIGPYSPEAAGDYASGPNHVLPTGGYARLRGGLSAADFVKVISVQRLTREGLESIAPAITTLARAEGLEAHARSVEVRSEQIRSEVV